MLTFDDILEKKIEFGRTQVQTFAFLAFSCFMDGFQVFYLISILTVQKNDFDLSQSDLKVLTTCQFFGMVLSYIVYSTMTDRLGRKNLLMIGLMLLSFALMFHSFANGVVILGISRFLMGTTAGWLWGLPLIIMIEIVPAKFRGRISNAAEVSYILGVIYMSFSCLLAFDSLVQGNWRVLSQINSILTLVCFLIILLRVDESPRFHLVKGRYELAWQGIDKMGKTNKPKEYICLTVEEKDKLIQWQQAFMKSQKRKPGFRALFATGYKKTTIRIWILSVFMNVQDKALLVIMPFIFAKSELSLLNQVLTYAVELPAAFLTATIIDSKKYGGRIRGLTFGVFLLNISILSLYLDQNSAVLVSFFFIRFSVRWVQSFYNPLLIETYSTLLRSTGYGAAQVVGKLAGAITPYFVLSIYFASDSGVFLFLLGVGACCLIVLRFFSDDMTRQPLDMAKVPQNDLEVQTKKEEQIDPDDNDMEAVSLKEIN